MTAPALREPDHVYNAVAAECEIDPDVVLAHLADEIATPLAVTAMEDEQ